MASKPTSIISVSLTSEMDLIKRTWEGGERKRTGAREEADECVSATCTKLCTSTVDHSFQFDFKERQGWEKNIIIKKPSPLFFFSFSNVNCTIHSQWFFSFLSFFYHYSDMTKIHEKWIKMILFLAKSPIILLCLSKSASECDLFAGILFPWKPNCNHPPHPPPAPLLPPFSMHFHYHLRKNIHKLPKVYYFFFPHSSLLLFDSATISCLLRFKQSMLLQVHHQIHFG